MKNGAMAIDRSTFSLCMLLLLRDHLVILLLAVESCYTSAVVATDRHRRNEQNE